VILEIDFHALNIKRLFSNAVLIFICRQVGMSCVPPSDVADADDIIELRLRNAAIGKWHKLRNLTSL
jgi:hypothetical protein